MRSKVVLILFAVLILGGLAWKFLPGMKGGSAPAGFEGLAAAVPADARLFAGAELRGKLDLKKTVATLREELKDSPKAVEGLKKAEERMGATLEELADMFAPAGWLVVLPWTDDQDPGAVAALVLADADKAQAWFDKRVQADSLQETQEQGVKVFSLGTDKGVVAINRGYLLLASDTPSLSKVLTTQAGSTPALKAQPAFVQALKRAPVKVGLLGFADLKPVIDQVASVRELSEYLDDSSKQALGAFQMGVVGVDLQSAASGYGFLAIDPQNPSSLAKALLAAPTADGATTRFFPQGWNNYNAVQLPYIYHVLLESALLVPETRSRVRMAPMAFRMATGGIDLENGLFAALTGEVAWSIKGLEAPGGPQAVGIVLGVKDADKTRDILGRLGRRLGQGEKRKVGGWEVTDFGLAALALVDKPAPAVVIVAGENAASWEPALQELQAPTQPVSEFAPLKQALTDSKGHWVSLTYLDLSALAQAFKGGFDAALAREQADPATQAIQAKVDAWLDSLAEAKDVSVVTVDPDGLAYRSTGGGGLMVAAGGIGAAILVPNFIKAREQGQLTACKSNLKNIGTGLEMWSTDNGGRYPKSLKELTPDYLKYIPSCPAAGSDTYSATYQVSEKPDLYTVMCGGHHHSDIPADYPMYTAIQGLIER